MKLAEILTKVLNVDVKEVHEALSERLEKAGYSLIYEISTDGAKMYNIPVPEASFSPESIIFLGYDVDFTKSFINKNRSNKNVPTRALVYSLPVSKKLELDDLVELPVKGDKGVVTFASELLVREHDYIRGDHSFPIALYVKAFRGRNQYFAQRKEIAKTVKVIRQDLSHKESHIIPLTKEDIRQYRDVLAQLKPLI